MTHMAKFGESMKSARVSVRIARAADAAGGSHAACTTKEFYTDLWHNAVVSAPGHRDSAKELCADQWHYAISGAPGRHDFSKNMTSGASRAEAILITVPADGTLTAAIAKGNHETKEIQGQMCQHSKLASALGVKQIRIGIDETNCDTATYSDLFGLLWDAFYQAMIAVPNFFINIIVHIEILFDIENEGEKVKPTEFVMKGVANESDKTVCGLCVGNRSILGTARRKSGTLRPGITDLHKCRSPRVAVPAAALAASVRCRTCCHSAVAVAAGSCCGGGCCSAAAACRRHCQCSAAAVAACSAAAACKACHCSCGSCCCC